MTAASKKTRFPAMGNEHRKKKKAITIFYPDELIERLAVLKTRAGGVTAFFEKCIREADISKAELEAIRLLRK